MLARRLAFRSCARQINSLTDTEAERRHNAICWPRWWAKLGLIGHNRQGVSVVQKRSCARGAGQELLTQLATVEADAKERRSARAYGEVGKAPRPRGDRAGSRASREPSGNWKRCGCVRVFGMQRQSDVDTPGAHSPAGHGSSQRRAANGAK